MIEVKVKTEILKKSLSILEKVNLGQRGVADGNYEEQKVGLIGQLTIYDLYKIDHPNFENSQFDGGYDIMFNNKKTVKLQCTPG